MAREQQSPSFKALDATHQMKQLGARIKTFRRKKGYTSAERFANDHDVHRVQWGRYENGYDLYVSSLFNVLKALDVTPAEFFSEGFDTV